MMQFWETYDWRTKNRLLWIAAVLFGVACYQLALKPTLRLRAEYRELRTGEAARQANMQVLAELRASANKAGQLFDLDDAGTAVDTLLSEPERIALLAQQRGVEVRSLPAPQQLDAELLRLYYTEYQVEGVFVNVLQMLRDIEQQQDIQVLSASFVKQPNPATRAPELVLHVRTVRLVND
ncbi:hypothetical protein [Parapedobacter sp. DT-150]|uniref:hypothetical protein n=1 Tax=Parapedobacter sp. DT-150 TaxID=3396162 RepID=UPI003F1B6DC7